MKRLTVLALLLYPAVTLAAVPVEITAQKVEGNVNTFVKATGRVVVRYKDVVIEGDRATYDRKTGIIRVWGNVTVEEKPALLHCRELVYNLKTKRALLTDVEGYLSPTDRIKAKEIRRLSEKLWIAYDGEYTPCPHRCPDWSVTAKRFKILLGESFSGKWVAFRVKEIPVLITPYLSGPIQKKRKSGFLTPRIGYVSNDGFVYRQPVYFVLGRSADLTLTYEKRSINGEGVEAALRYVLGERNRGDVSYYQLNRREGKDWKVNLYHTYNPSDYLYFKANVDVVSSRSYYINSADFNIEEQTKLYTKSTVTGSKLWERAILNVNSAYFRYLIGSTNTAYQKVPEVNFYLMDSKIPRTPLSFSFSSDLTYFYREAGGSSYRLNAVPSLRLTEKLGVVKNSSKLSYLFTSYQMGGSRHLWQFKNTSAVNRFFRFGSYGISLNPKLSFLYRESESQSSNPLFDLSDRLEGKRTVTPEVDTFIYSPKGRIARMSLSAEYSLTGSWKNFSFDVDTSPFSWLGVRETLLFSPSDGELRFSNTQLTLNFNGKSLWSNYYRQNIPERITYLRWGTSFPINRYLSFSYQQRYDLKLKEDRERQYSLQVNRGCWVGNLSYRWIKNYDNTVDYQVILRIDLLKLGSYGYKLSGKK